MWAICSVSSASRVVFSKGRLHCELFAIRGDCNQGAICT
jgi:hypothetical protein